MKIKETIVHVFISASGTVGIIRDGYSTSSTEIIMPVVKSRDWIDRYNAFLKKHYKKENHCVKGGVHSLLETAYIRIISRREFSGRMGWIAADYIEGNAVLVKKSWKLHAFWHRVNRNTPQRLRRIFEHFASARAKKIARKK
jgi:hypothetical protein